MKQIIYSFTGKASDLLADLIKIQHEEEQKDAEYNAIHEGEKEA